MVSAPRLATKTRLPSAAIAGGLDGSSTSAVEVATADSVPVVTVAPVSSQSSAAQLAGHHHEVVERAPGAEVPIPAGSRIGSAAVSSRPSPSRTQPVKDRCRDRRPAARRRPPRPGARATLLPLAHRAAAGELQRVETSVRARHRRWRSCRPSRSRSARPRGVAVRAQRQMAGAVAAGLAGGQQVSEPSGRRAQAADVPARPRDREQPRHARVADQAGRGGEGQRPPARSRWTRPPDALVQQRRTPVALPSDSAV